MAGQFVALFILGLLFGYLLWIWLRPDPRRAFTYKTRRPDDTLIGSPRPEDEDPPGTTD